MRKFNRLRDCTVPSGSISYASSNLLNKTGVFSKRYLAIHTEIVQRKWRPTKGLDEWAKGLIKNGGNKRPQLTSY